MSETQVEQADASTQVEVSRSIAAPLTHVWETLVSDAGAEALLGDGARFGTKGESWHSSEGHRGVVRSYHPMEQLRVSWHETEDAPMSMVQIDVQSAGSSTAVNLRHDRVRGDLDEDLQWWNEALDRFEKAVLS
jgi:uncharacterized protein YndB with AHSA1/START domain